VCLFRIKRTGATRAGEEKQINFKIRWRGNVAEHPIGCFATPSQLVWANKLSSSTKVRGYGTR